MTVYMVDIQYLEEDEDGNQQPGEDGGVIVEAQTAEEAKHHVRKTQEPHNVLVQGSYTNLSQASYTDVESWGVIFPQADPPKRIVPEKAEPVYE
jgi:hypothetical protein